MEKPLVIGIAGGTGSGKTTVADALAAAAPRGTATLLQHDSYYRDRPDLTYDDKAQLNYDHPESLETELLVRHLEELLAGRAVEVPRYDFTTHSRSVSTTHLEPTPVIIVEGILVFADERLRRLFDIKIFVDTDPDIRVFRRIRRDMDHRGRSFSQIREHYYATVRPMHLQFVEPSKRWADLILPEGGKNRVGLDLLLSHLRGHLGLPSRPPPPPGA